MWHTYCFIIRVKVSKAKGEDLFIQFFSVPGVRYFKNDKEQFH